MSHFVAFADSFALMMTPVLADATAWVIGVAGVVIAIVIAVVVFSSANRAAEEARERLRQAEAMAAQAGGGGSEQQPGSQGEAPHSLPSVFGLGGPAIKAPTAQEKREKLGEPERFDVVREALVAVLDDMDMTDAQFVVPDMALQRDLGLEEKQIEQLLTELGKRFELPVTPELYARAGGEDDLELRELLGRLTGTHVEQEEEGQADEAPGDGAQ